MSNQVARKNSYPKKLLANWAKARATEHHRALRLGGSSHKPTLGYRIAKKLIFSKIHAALGLDRATVQVNPGKDGFLTECSLRELPYYITTGWSIWSDSGLG